MLQLVDAGLEGGGGVRDVHQAPALSLRHGLDGVLNTCVIIPCPVILFPVFFSHLVDAVGLHQLLVHGPVGVKDDDHVLAAHLPGLLLHLHSLLQIIVGSIQII